MNKINFGNMPIQRKCRCNYCLNGGNCGRVVTPFTTDDDDDDDGCNGDNSCNDCIAINGYCRNMYNNHQINIPKLVISLLQQYYHKKKK